MQIDLKRFQETFFEEAEEHLGTIESGLLSLTEQGAGHRVAQYDLPLGALHQGRCRELRLQRTRDA